MSYSTALTKCRNCRNTKENIITLCKNKIYKPLHEVQCSKCNDIWLICVFHKKRFAHRSYFRAKQHLEEIDHSSALKSLSVTSSSNSVNTSFIDENSVFDDNSGIINDINEKEAVDFPEVDSCHVSEYVDDCYRIFESNHTTINLKDYNNVTKRYFECDTIVKGDGIRRIVACAFKMNLNSNYSEVSLEEAKYHIKSTLFTFNLTSTQKEQFASICHQMASTFYSSVTNIDGNPSTSPPMTTIDIDRYYLNISTSIANNIPIPNVIESYEHACVSIKEAIQHYLCFQTYIDGMFIEKPTKNYKKIISTSSSMTSSNASDIIRSRLRSAVDTSNVSPLILYVIVWSDDFEPNNVKQHKKSTWIKTITIAPPPDCQTSSRYTYIVALGSKSLDHETVNFYFNQELNELKMPTYMYCKATNSNIPIVVDVLANSADRPERSALNFMLGHNGITSRRWRYSAYINTKKTKSCSNCMLRRVESVRTSSFTARDTFPTCCCDWDFQNPGMKVEKPSEYPTSEHPKSPKPPPGREVKNIEFLYPIELSYEHLIQGAKYSFFNCYHRMWNKTSTVTYLKSLGINEKYAVDYIYDTALTCRSIVNFDESSLYNHLTFPVLWTSSSTLDQCIDTPMHQIFQGVVKSIVEETADWLTRKYKPQYKAFGDMVNSMLSKIHDVGVDWCRMERLLKGRTYSMSGWQAEQYIAFARCMLVIYASIRDIVGDDETGIDEHECMIQSLICFISRMMNDEGICFNEHTDYIKMFLSCCDMFENITYNLNEQNPFWYKKGNFLSLLNLPSQVQKFGSLKNFWEGSRERSIQQIKPYLIKTRSTSSFYKTKLQKMYIAQTMQNIHDDMMDDEISNVQTYERYSAFVMYSYSQDISDLISDMNVLSGIVIEHESARDKFYICQRMRDSDFCAMHEIKFDDEEGFNKCGIWYTPIEIKDSPSYVEMSKEKIQNLVIDYVLLLPCISEHEILNRCYTVLSRSWKARTTASKLAFPSISFDFVSETIHKNMSKS